MTPFGQFVRIERTKRGWGQADFAARIARSQSFVSDLENQDRSFGRGVVELAIAALKAGLPEHEARRIESEGLLAAGLIKIPAAASPAIEALGKPVDLSAFGNVPLVGRATGSVYRVAEVTSGYSSADSVLPNNVKAIELSGDSMEPSYRNGDVLFIQETTEAHDGDEVIAIVGAFDGLTCKVYRNRDGQRFLEPINGEGRIQDFLIAGIVVGFFRRTRRS